MKSNSKFYCPCIYLAHTLISDFSDSTAIILLMNQTFLGNDLSLAMLDDLPALSSILKCSRCQYHNTICRPSVKRNLSKCQSCVSTGAKCSSSSEEESKAMFMFARFGPGGVWAISDNAYNNPFGKLMPVCLWACKLQHHFIQILEDDVSSDILRSLHRLGKNLRRVVGASLFSMQL